MKRVVDFSFSLFALVLLSPCLLLAAILIWVNLGNPIIFLQRRPGLNGRPFQMVKFRTMLDEVDSDGNELTHSERLTSLGKFIRSTSVDELPQLLNVLKGDMSLVGPRPLMTEYLPLYDTYQARRHEVRPGITGWAQINGRNTISWEEKFQLDVWYVENKSFFLDLKILLLTFYNVALRKNIYDSENNIMPPFTGS
jgi:sugar transferase EpsL